MILTTESVVTDKKEKECKCGNEDKSGSIFEDRRKEDRRKEDRRKTSNIVDINRRKEERRKTDRRKH
jgi:hypothetical protein